MHQTCVLPTNLLFSFVGKKYYHKTGDSVRAGFIYKLGKREGNEEDATAAGSQPTKKSRVGEEDDNLRVKLARDKLKETKQRRLTLGKNCNILPCDKLFIQKFFTNPANYGLTKLDANKKFPGMS